MLGCGVKGGEGRERGNMKRRRRRMSEWVKTREECVRLMNGREVS